MALILGISVMVLGLALEIAAFYLDLSFMRWFRLEGHTVISRIMAAFLSGFVVFVLFTDRIPTLGQRLAIIAVSASLIYANLYLGKEQEKTGSAEGGEGISNLENGE